MNLSAQYLLVIALVIAGCGGTSAKHQRTTLPTSDAPHTSTTSAPIDEASPRPTIMVEPMRIEVIRDAQGNEQVIARDARGLFDEANDALALGEYERALTVYDDLLTDFSESSLAPPALYNAGLALEGLGKEDEAVARYLALAARKGSGEEGIDARIRAAALLAERERWNESLGVLDDMLALPMLRPSSRLEGMARRGYVLLEAKDYAAAEKQLTTSITHYNAQKAKRVVFDDDYFAAMAYFYLGDIARRQFDVIPIRLPENQMARDVEAKASLVMLASDRFGDTVEFGNIYWATAAGFRLADMQREFWVALMQAPVPPHLKEQAASLYVSEVHKHALSLLEKALSIHGKNVQLATLYKVPTPWSEASAREVVRLTELVGREQAGELLNAKELQVDARRRVPVAYMPGRVEL